MFDDDDDKGFFILVLGVLAAILLVVSWWAIRDDDDSLLTGPPAAELEADDDSGDDAAAEEEAAAEPEPTPEPEPTAEPEPEPTAEPEPTPEPEPTAEPEPEPDDDASATAGASGITVADLVGGNANLSGVAGLVAGAGLGDVLAGDGPFTVLAPSNAALDSVDPAVAARLLSEANATDTLTYHVIPGAYTSADLIELIGDADSIEVDTVQGDPVSLSLDGDQIVVNGNAVVSEADDEADNGVVHTIENVLVPREAALNLIVGLEPIQFASGSAVISAESEATLDRVVEALQTSEVAVTVEGHTDDQGDDQLNQALSLDRARAVVNYLVANGIDEARLTAEGYGEERPIADNGTEEGRAENRRIEFRVQR